LGLSELFPDVDYRVVASLDRDDLDALDQALSFHAPPPLGENATRDFVLHHVFHVDVDRITIAADLLHELLALHAGGRALPAALSAHLVERIQRRPVFDGWPIARLVGDREALLRFLQERWPRFVGQWLARHDTSVVSNGARLVAEAPVRYEVDGPVDLPFADDGVRPYVDTLFLEGLLMPMQMPAVEPAAQEQLGQAWLAVGIRRDPLAERAQRLARLVESLESAVPGPDARHHEWLTFARTWSELTVLACDSRIASDAQTTERGTRLRQQVDAAFLDWTCRRYSALYSQLGAEPVMLHHVPRAMARCLELADAARVALVVLDGLALDQWAILRAVLGDQEPSLRFHEGAVFAWLPTITSVSRQALFAGKPPMHFPSSIRTTAREEVLWRQFWVDGGLSPGEVAYEKGLGASGTLVVVDQVLSLPRLRVVGLVVKTVDEIMHGMQLGTAGMHNQVRQWADQGFMRGLLDRLLDAGFSVFLTADHGNIEVLGCGSPSEAALAVTRGERVRVYADSLLRAQVKARIPDAIEWSAPGLPADYQPLLAPGRAAFIARGEQRISHGGITLEEVIVPLVRVDRSTT
jgi:hypothetical protein